jgi:hypothetical protein
MTEGKWVVLLSNSERMALIDVLIEHQMEPACSKEFVDCSVPGGKTTHHGDLLRILDRAPWFSEFPGEKIINSVLEIPKQVKS